MTHTSHPDHRSVFGAAATIVAFSVLCTMAPAMAQETSPPPDNAPEPAVSEPPALDPAPETSEATTTTPAAEAATPPVQVTPNGHVTGHIWRMTPGLVFLRTPIGLMTLSCKTCLRDLKGGPTVTVYMHGQQGAVYITPRGSAAPSQRYLWGPIPAGGNAGPSISMWTPDGPQAVSIDKLAAKLAAIPAGRAVTLEVSPGGAVVGLHELHVDLQVSQLPVQSSSTELHVTGSVSKIKNGYVHVQTDLGLLPITAKTGLCLAKDKCHTKVGEELTLWIHDTTAAIDLYAKGSKVPSRRLLSGKLAYAGADKSAVSLWTPNGERSFPTDRGRTALASLKEGTPIIVELDGDGAVQEIRKGN